MRKLLILMLLAYSFSGMSQSYFLQMGINHYEEEKYDEAVTFFNKELQKHPKEGQAYYYLAKIQMKKDAFAEGLRQVNLAIANLADTDTIMARAWIAKGDIYQRLTDTVKFEAAYAKAIQLFPDLPEVYMERASSYETWNWLAKAKADLLKVIDLDASHLGARTVLCSIYLQEKKYDAIIREASKMIALDPNYVQSYDYRSQAYFYSKKYDLAIQDAYTALTLEDRSSRLRYNYLVFGKKNFSMAIAKISTLINEFPQKDLFYLVRSQLYQEKKDFDKALKDFDRIFEIVSENLHAYYFDKRADLFGAMGMHQQAAADYSESIKLDSTESSTIGSRGDEYRLLGKYDLALADFDRAIELDPESAFYYMQRGWVKDEFLGNHADGLADYTSAIELDSSLAYAYLYRGRAYKKSFNDLIRANADFKKVITLDTSIGSGGNVRHYAYAELGQEAEAKIWMSKILAEYPEDGNYYDAACLYSLLKKPIESVAYLDTAFQKGYRDFVHLAKDDDLDGVRNLPAFKTLVLQWKAKFESKAIPSTALHQEDRKIKGTYIVPFKKDQGGTFEVASKVNGLPLKMLFDTGAGDVTISQMEVDFMIKNGYMSEKDFIGKASYNMANGENIIAKTVLLKKVELGGLIIENVVAAVVENREAGMLFGQSAMGRYATITIDNKKKQLVITGHGK
jgi:clan AA aspartic protease (TIGR02281 family)